jgi:hypothetical protein
MRQTIQNSEAVTPHSSRDAEGCCDERSVREDQQVRSEHAVERAHDDEDEQTAAEKKFQHTTPQIELVMNS